MVNRKDWIRTTSGLVFKAKEHRLVSWAIRFKVTFDQEIDRARMQQALEKALEIYPYMGMSMREEEGSMWYVPNPSPAAILDAVPECLGGEETRHHMFCLVCDRRTLEFAVFHGLTDGAGSMQFLDALLEAYFSKDGSASVASQKAGILNQAVDVLDLDPDLPKNYVPEALMPEHAFAFPRTTESETTGSGQAGSETIRSEIQESDSKEPGTADQIMAVFSRQELSDFCKEHDCSVTSALVTWISMALQRTYTENSAPICVRCPVNSRTIQGVPNTFMNASIPQVLLSVEAAKAADGRVDEIVEEVTAQIRSQTIRDRVACFHHVIGAMLRHETVPDAQSIKDIYRAPVVFSNLGTLTSDDAVRHIKGIEASAYGDTSLMINLITAGNQCYLTFTQNFEGTAYQDALQQVMEECGVGLCLFGRIARFPRFMDRMARIVQRYQDRTAVVDDQRSMTYAELDQESGKIYHYLKRNGVGRESMVQIVMPRCAGYYSCIGGVLRAGAAFVPLEENYPEQRIAYIRADSGCVCVLDEALYQKIMEQEEYLGGYEKTDVHDACYAVYTSGSTGNPKGALHEYGSMDAQAFQTPERDEYPPSQRGMMTPFYFAAAYTFNSDDFLSAGTVHVIQRDVVHNLSLLAEFIEEHKIEKIFMTPSYVRMYQHPAPSLKVIIVAGEPANKVYYDGGVPRIHNTLGLSEAGFLLAGADFERSYDIAPIGRPLIPYEDLHLEDEDGRRIVGPGEGELCYHNLYFRGYINLPDKTAHALRNGVFHTNDQARRDENGVFYVVGRLDDMFKINGNRIEPAEIERRVREATGLEQVVAKGVTEGGRSFVCAYFLKEEAQRLNIWDGNRLTCSLDSLHAHLPDYMIPAHYVALDEFPHNANGKLVRKQLPAPRVDVGERPYTAPEGEKETLLCSLMGQALHLDRVGAEDDFYEIGGDSMGAVVLLGLCEEAGLTIPLSMLYRNRTPRALAAAWEAGQALAGNMSELAKEAMKKPQPILYDMRQHLRQLEEEPDALIYNIPQLLKLKKGTDLIRLSAALDRVFRAHPALNSTFRKTDGEWYQVFDESLFEPTRIITMSDEEFQQEMTHIVAPLPALGGTPHRRAIYHTDSADYMFWDIHHSIADGTSTTLLRDQVWSCYADPDYVIPEDLYTWFLEETGKLQRDAAAPENAEAKEFYDKHTDSDPESLVLRPDLAGPDGEAVTLSGHREQDRTADGGSSLFLAASAMAAAALNDTHKALIYTVYHGRDQEAKRWSVGMYAVSTPVYLDLEKQQTAEEILSDVREQLNFGMAHSAYPFKYLHPAPECNTVLFNYQKNTFDLGDLSAIIEERVPIPFAPNGMVLITGLIDIKGNEKLTWYCGYNTGWYSKERIEAFHECFKKAAAWLMAPEPGSKASSRMLFSES